MKTYGTVSSDTLSLINGTLQAFRFLASKNATSLVGYTYFWYGGWLGLGLSPIPNADSLVQVLYSSGMVTGEMFSIM